MVGDVRRALLLQASLKELSAVKRFLRYSLIFPILLALVTSCPECANAAGEVLVVQSVTIPLYDEVINGFGTTCHHREIEQLLVGKLTAHETANHVDSLRPDLILTIGPSALKKIEQIKRVPIVYCMVLNSPENPLINGSNITGVSMNIPQDQQLRTFTAALPTIKTIGILYDPKRTGSLVEKASAAAKKMRIDLNAKPVNSPKEVAPALQSMQRKIDAFWMLPDLTVVNGVTIEHMLSFAVAHRIPILTFSDKYVEQGALMAMSIDTFDMGAQAGEMAAAILSGTPVSDVPPQEARKGILFINLKVATKLNITIDEKIIKNSMTID